MGQNTRKSDFFCMILTTLTKTGGGGTGCFIYSKTLLVSFGKIEI